MLNLKDHMKKIERKEKEKKKKKKKEPRNHIDAIKMDHN